MKLTYTFLLLLSLFTILTASECRKTTTPEFYFTCKVDGQEYVPNGCANCMVARVLYQNTFLVLGGNRDYESIILGAIDSSGLKKKSYLLNNRNGYKGDYKNSTLINDTFTTDSIHIGTLVLTEIDSNNKIISGNFNFIGYNPSQNKTVNISNGSFRLKYTTN